MNVSRRLTRATGSSLLYQCMEIILFPALLQNKDDYRNEDNIWNTLSDILYFKKLVGENCLKLVDSVIQLDPGQIDRKRVLSGSHMGSRHVCFARYERIYIPCCGIFSSHLNSSHIKCCKFG